MEYEFRGDVLITSKGSSPAILWDFGAVWDDSSTPIPKRVISHLQASGPSPKRFGDRSPGRVPV